MKKLYLIIICIFISFQISLSQKNEKYFNDGFLDSLELKTFNYFWKTTNPNTGLVFDRYPTKSFSSVAAIGFGLTAYGIGAERGYVKRIEAAERVLQTLKYLYNLPQNSDVLGSAGYRGFFYHFLKTENGTRFGTDVELSTIDTALLMSGILFCQSYFSKENEIENEIRQYADLLYRRVEWNWILARPPRIAMGWYPEKGFHHLDWVGYNESAILYILAQGSPTFKIPNEAFDSFTSTNSWLEFNGYEFVSFGPLFGHQFSHCWIDFREIKDNYMRVKGIDYFENSRRATYANRDYAINNPKKWNGYSDSLWGISACDGPADVMMKFNNEERRFISYGGRGVAPDFNLDDGTLTPTAVGGSIAFAPEICVPTLKTMRNYQNGILWNEFGFVDAFNPSYITEKTPNGWVDVDYLGLDQGPIIIMIENLRSELVWNVMKKINILLLD